MLYSPRIYLGAVVSVNKDIENDWSWFPPLTDPIAPTDQVIVRRSNGRVYRAEASDLSPTNSVFVTQSDQLLDIDPSKNYIIDGAIDMGSTPITVPPGGVTLAGLAGARDTALLYSSEDDYTMFVTEAGSYSGDVIFDNMGVSVTGTSSKVFDLDNAGNSGALDITIFNFVDCTSLGELTDYRQFFIGSAGFIRVDDGLTFSGAWSGLVATDSIALEFPSTTLFKEGTDLTFSGSVRSNMNFLLADAGATFMDFQESNIVSDEGLLLQGFRTSVTDAMPNLPSNSVKVRYVGCRGIRDTYVGGQWVVSSSAVTTIAAADTKYKVAGTVSYDDLQWFSDGGGNNSMTYISAQSVEVEVKCVLTATGTNGDQINLWLRKWDDSASAYVDISSSGLNTLNASGRNEGIPLFGYALVNENDRLELWVENKSGARNVTISTGGLFGVTER